MPIEAALPDHTIYTGYLVAGIIVTSFALWTDYLGRHLEHLSREEPEFDRVAEMRRVRQAGFLVFILQALTYLGGGQVRVKHPIPSLLIFVVSIMIQGQLQFGVEKKIRGLVASQQQHLGQAFRSLSMMLVSMLGYFGVVYAVSLASFGLAALLKAPTWAQGAAGLAGAIAGIFAGLALSFAFAPMTMRKMLPVSRLDDESVRQSLDACFHRAGLATPTYWVIEVDHFRANNAFVAGFRNGKGWFRPALFITRPLLKECSTNELQAIILHEVSHLALNHLRNRFLYSFTAVMAAILSTAALLVAAQLFLPAPAAQWIVLGGAVLAFAAPYIAIRNHGQGQELEADTFAIIKLGSTLEAVAGALRRIDLLNDQGQEAFGHPKTESRILQIRQAVEFAESLRKAMEKAPAGAESGGTNRKKAA